MKRACVLLALISLVAVSSAVAQTTFSYDARVTAADGPDAATFTAGDRVIITYTLNPSVPDGNGDPSTGSFPNAVLSMSVSFPDIGISVTAGAAGNAQTFNNLADGLGRLTDQVFFFGGPISSASPLGGLPIESVEVDFLSNLTIPPDEPTLLSSDALPLSHLSIVNAFVILSNGNGVTFVNFEAAPPPPTTCTVTPTYAGGTLTMNFTVGTVQPADWHVALLLAGNVFTLFKAPLPATAPVSFPLPVPGFPALGNIGLLSTLTGPGGLTCTDLKTVDTGGPASRRVP